MNAEQLSRAIREARAKVNQQRKKAGQKTITQGQIAKELNISVTTLSEWERGKKQPKVLNLIAYCDFLGVSIDDMLGVKKNAFCSI